MIRIMLAEGHHVVRQALRSLLESETGFEIIGESSNGLETIRLVEILKPDVLVLDLMMPSFNGLEVVREISQKQPQTGVVILSMHADEPYLWEALKNGALAYVSKNSQASNFVEAIRSAALGKRYLSAPISDLLIDSFTKRGKDGLPNKYEDLTTRERQVLHLVVEGHTNAEVASLLSISRRTVEVHRAHLMQKLNLNNQAELVRFALKNTPQAD